MNILVLAGRRENGSFGDKTKALLQIHNKYSIEYILESIIKSKYYENTHGIYISCHKEDIDSINTVIKENSLLNSQSNNIKLIDNSHKQLISKIIVEFHQQNNQTSLLTLTADHPVLNYDDINNFLDAVQEIDSNIYYGMVNGQAEFRTKYPDLFNTRTWHKLNNNTWLSGANISYIKQSIKNKDFLMSLEKNRKNPLKTISSFSPKSILFLFKCLTKYLFKNLSLKEFEQAISETFQQDFKIILLNKPEACCDIDKQEDLEFVRKYLK